MIPSIHMRNHSHSLVFDGEKPVSFSTNYSSTLSSLKGPSCCCLPVQLCCRIFKWIWGHLAEAFYAFTDKFAPSTEELSLLEEILEGAFFGAAIFVYEQSQGRERFVQVVKKCHMLYERLTKKWFPNMEGTLFLRINLMKIAIRCHALLGETERIAFCREMLKRMGGKMDENVEKQIEIFSFLSEKQWKPQMAMMVINFIAQATASLLSSTKSNRNICK